MNQGAGPPSLSLSGREPATGSFVRLRRAPIGPAPRVAPCRHVSAPHSCQWSQRAASADAPQCSQRAA